MPGTYRHLDPNRERHWLLASLFSLGMPRRSLRCGREDHPCEQRGVLFILAPRRAQWPAQFGHSALQLGHGRAEIRCSAREQFLFFDSRDWDRASFAGLDHRIAEELALGGVEHRVRRECLRERRHRPARGHQDRQPTTDCPLARTSSMAARKERCASNFVLRVQRSRYSLALASGQPSAAWYGCFEPAIAGSAMTIRRRSVTAGRSGSPATTTSAAHPECTRKPNAAGVFAPVWTSLSFAGVTPFMPTSGTSGHDLVKCCRLTWKGISSRDQGGQIVSRPIRFLVPACRSGKEEIQQGRRLW